MSYLKLICCWLFVASGTELLAQPTGNAPQADSLDAAVTAAFLEVHDGWSTDEVLLQDELNQRFLDACRVRWPDGNDRDLNWRLIALRKAGKLGQVATRTRRDNHDAYQAAAEIAARMLEDKHRLNTDRVMCDPQLRREFDQVAGQLAEGVEPYLLRKAAFGLRKARRLQPELVLRVADWGRAVTVHWLLEVQADVSGIAAAPGVYLFRNPDGYLYIGESQNLRNRMAQHLDETKAGSLIQIIRKQKIALDDVQIEFHVFDPHSRAREVRVRRAYESQLIDSRQPRFNVRP